MEHKKNKKSKKNKSEKVQKKNTFYGDVEPGITLIWKNKFSEAEKYFENEMKTKPRHALHFAEVPVLRSFITEGEEDRVNAIDRLQHTIELGEEHVKIFEKGKVPSDLKNLSDKDLKNWLLDTKIVLADAYTMLAAMQVLNETRIKGAFNLRKGWKLYEGSLSALSDDAKDSYDASVLSSLQFGAGLFYLVVSLIPPGFAQKAAQLVGFKANKSLGLELLRAAHKAGSVRSAFSGILLAINHLLLSPGLDKTTMHHFVQEAESIISAGLSAYPEGSFFQVTKALCDMEKGKLQESIESFEQGIHNCSSITSHPPIFYRALSNCYLLRFQWKEAIDLLSVLVDLHRTEGSSRSADSAWATPWHLVKLGAAYQMIGDEEKSLELFEEASQVKNSDKFSVYIVKLATRYVKNGGKFSQWELLYLTGHYDKLLNNIASKQTKEQILDMIENAAKTAEGALNENLIESISAPKKGGMLSLLSFGLISNGDELNHPHIDNRVSYLTLKASLLRSLGDSQSAKTMLVEILEVLKDHLVDKMYLAFALIEMGKCVGKEDADSALAYFREALKLSGYPWEEQVNHRLRIYMNQLGVDIDKEEEEKE